MYTEARLKFMLARGIIRTMTKSPELIYCAGGSEAFATMAVKYGWTYGSRLPATVYYKPEFADQPYHAPNRPAYMQALAQHTPRLATVLDLERPDQLSEVLEWATEAAQHATESVLIIPKYAGAISQLPRTIAGKEVRLAYSVKTSYGQTPVDVSEFVGWPVHLLGGSPVEQAKKARAMNVVSVDTNQAQYFANKCSIFLNRGSRYRVQLADLGITHTGQQAMHDAFRISMVNMSAAWLPCPAWIRPALVDHIPMIKKIATQYPSELGFVNSAALQDSIVRGGLWVALIGQKVVGFVNYRARRDGVSVVYEIAVHKDFRGAKIGTALLSTVPLPRKLKCTVDNTANQFYEKSMQLVGVEEGRKRALNVWQQEAL